MALTETASRFSELIDGLRERAGVKNVFGDPIEREGRTVVPVARVAYGFGGGFGSGGDAACAAGEESEAGDESEDGARSYGEGGGGGGGAVARPVGALEITDTGTAFVRFRDSRRANGALAVGLGLGYFLGRIAGRREYERDD
jgi:uncharacterized spore protein YtfJ